MAALTNASTSDIDKTSFWWTGLCAICHPGGGPSEYDREGDTYYNASTDVMGYVARSEPAGYEVHNGDYSNVSNATGAETAPAPWNKTGVLEPDCLYCHRLTRHVDLTGGLAAAGNGDWAARAASLRGTSGLQSSGAGGVPVYDVPAYAAAPAAAQMWATVAFATVPPGKPPKAATLDFNYAQGVTDGSLLAQADGTLKINKAEIVTTPKDFACWGCHVIADDKKRGRVWFDPDEDVHYAGFNNVNSGMPASQQEQIALASNACTRCHPNTGTVEFPMGSAPNDGEHNFAKGNANLGSVRNDTDWYGFKSCRDCHLPGADKDPDAPEPVNPVHTNIGGIHLANISCQFCHIGLKHDNASLSIDNATTGSTINYNTDKFLTSYPTDHTMGDTSAWYPSATVRADKDLVDRLFPAKLLLSTWVGDWDGTPATGPVGTDRVASVFLWRLRGAISTTALAANDDNNDTLPEVNTDAELINYLTTLQTATDQHGVNIINGTAVFVKGDKVWYMDGATLEHWEVAAFPDVKVEGEHPFSIDHNVLPLSQGTTLGAVTGCTDCHTTQPGTPTAQFPAQWVFDREILVDPFDTQSETGDDGAGAVPIFKKLRDLLPAGTLPST